MQTTVLEEILLALIPYTKRNTTLVTNPKKFIYELERRSGIKQQSLSTAYYRAKREGYINCSNNEISLSTSGIERIQPKLAKRMLGNVQLMVIFDIPESKRIKRNSFRSVLRQLSFRQVQKSVWLSSYDQEICIREAVKLLGIEEYVKIFECINR